MNFIVIIADTLRRDHLGCYGSEWIHTPHIDRLAGRAMVFDRAYAASFPTGPHRKDLHTGRFSFTYSPWSALDPKEVTLAACLSRAGYVTMLLGDTPALHGGYANGFTGYEILRGQATDPWHTDKVAFRLAADIRKLRGPKSRVAHYFQNTNRWRTEQDTFVATAMRRAVEWLEYNYQHEKFFLCVDVFDPHEPWLAPRWYVERYDPGYKGQEVFSPAYRTAGFMTEAELRHMRALYAAEVTLVDRWIGHLLETVEQMGLFDNTVVCVTTDHGFYHGDHGLVGKVDLRGDYTRWPLYEEMVHIPMVLRAPGVRPGRCSAFVQPPDIMPTILDVAGIPVPKTVQGKSLRPLVERKARAHRPWALSSWTLVQDREVRPPSTLTTREWAFIHGGDEAEHALYHLPSDPGQKKNLFARRRGAAERLHVRYLRILKSLGVSDEGIALRADLDAPRRRARGIHRSL